ncbi:MAG: hypothetical protein J6B84_10600 [Eubacterium sp.]|nr:hypothetical protein [Eubacterium sp.]
MKKKIILCMVLAGLLFSLAGCAEESGQPEAGVQQENSKTSEEEFAETVRGRFLCICAERISRAVMARRQWI